LKTNQLNL